MRVRRSPGPASASDRFGEGLHAEVVAGAGGVGAIEAIEKRRDLEQPGTVLDEVLVNDLRDGQGRSSR